MDDGQDEPAGGRETDPRSNGLPDGLTGDQTD